MGCSTGSVIAARRGAAQTSIARALVLDPGHVDCTDLAGARDGYRPRGCRSAPSISIRRTNGGCRGRRHGHGADRSSGRAAVRRPACCARARASRRRPGAAGPAPIASASRTSSPQSKSDGRPCRSGCRRSRPRTTADSRCRQVCMRMWRWRRSQSSSSVTSLPGVSAGRAGSTACRICRLSRSQRVSSMAYRRPSSSTSQPLSPGWPPPSG